MNGEIILYSEVRERLFQMKSAAADQADKKTEAKALETLIDEKLIVQLGKEKEIEISEREVSAGKEERRRGEGTVTKEE